MERIPEIFDERPFDKSVITEQEIIKNPRLNMSVIVLDRGIRAYTPIALNMIKKFEPLQIIFVQNYKKVQTTSLDTLVSQYPYVNFIVPLENVSTGEMINAGISMAKSDFVLVIWSDMKLLTGFFSKTNISALEQKRTYCITPALLDNRLEPLTIRAFPSCKNDVFMIDRERDIPGKGRNFYPYDFVGIYNRAKFIDLLGYDATIKHDYWQNLDLSFRSWLWGEETILNTTFQMSYSSIPTAEDMSANIDSSLFYLKNLLPIKDDKGMRIPARSFLNFKVKSGANFNEAIKLYRRARAWISVEKDRFVTDAVSFLQSWEA